MNTLKSLFYYPSDQRKGIFALFCVFVFLLLVYYFIDFSSETPVDSKEKKEWLAQQIALDSLKNVTKEESSKIRPFNPNFITDFKGYKLGMSVAEIDRLLAFRKLDKYVNSAKEFQEVTKVSDSLLAQIEPYFKFPDWVKNKKEFKAFEKKFDNKNTKIEVKDINLASQEDLIKIYGIGPALSERILKQREILGAFVSMEQLEDVWGLSPETIQNVQKHFKIGTYSNINKIPINTASIKDLMKFPYFKYQLAKNIVTFRSMNGEIKNSEDLAKIKDFPVEKIKIIALYLEF